MKNILAIGAHPDDVEYGCGGALIKEAKAGNNLFLFIATTGEQAGSSRTRIKEQKEAAQILGVKKIFWGNFKDTRIPNDKRLVEVIDRIIKRIEPEEIYVNDLNDSHQDHRALAQGVVAASRYSKRVLFYESYTTLDFQPYIFVDIEDVLKQKLKSLKAHQSQITRPYPTGLDTLESAKSMANYRGFQGKVKYAEGFRALRFLKTII